MINKPAKIFGLAVLMVAALTLVYWNHFDNSFHFDDSHTITNNFYITDIHNLPLIFKDARTTSRLPTNQAYRPIITSLNAIDYWIAGGLDPKIFHWHIYLEFLLFLLLLYFLLLKVFETSSNKKHHYLALFGTAFFAFHTATADTINYIIARSDGFSTLMVLAGLLLYVSNAGWKKQLGLLPFVIGCLAKPTTLMLAPLLFVYEMVLEHPSVTIHSERTKFRNKLLNTLKSTASYFLLGFGMYFFTRSMFSETWSPSHQSPLHYLNTQPYVFWVYLKTFVLPIGLTADTDLELIKEYLAPKVIWGLLVIFSLIGIATFASRKRITLPITFGVLWFFIALIPSSSIIPLAEVMNHHRTFFPYIGLVMAVSWATFLIFNKAVTEPEPSYKKIGIAILAVALLSVHAYGTYQRNEVWNSDESLWRDVTIKSPKNGRGLMNYGLTEMKKGNTQEALNYFEKALETNYGTHAYLHINLGIATNALSDKNKDQKLKEKAENYFKKAVRLGPGYPATHYRYASWLYKNDRPTEAILYASRALELSPTHQPAKKILEKSWQATKNDMMAAKEIAENTNTPEAYLNLGLKYYRRGEYEKCIEASESALLLKPDYGSAYNNICTSYNKLGQYNKAAEACEKALKIDPHDKLARGNLNWGRAQQEKDQ